MQDRLRGFDSELETIDPIVYNYSLILAFPDATRETYEKLGKNYWVESPGIVLVCESIQFTRFPKNM